MQSAVRNGQKKHGHDTYGDNKDSDTAELKFNEKKKKRRVKGDKKAVVGVGLQLTYGPPIRNAASIKRDQTMLPLHLTKTMMHFHIIMISQMTICHW